MNDGMSGMVRTMNDGISGMVRTMNDGDEWYGKSTFLDISLASWYRCAYQPSYIESSRVISCLLHCFG